jgi:hypothetical protein
MSAQLVAALAGIEVDWRQRSMVTGSWRKNSTARRLVEVDGSGL